MSEAICCPLSEPDERAQVYHRTTRVARKQHVCEECSEVIAIGMRHDYVSQLFDGAWSTYRICLICVEIGDHFACGGRIVGCLWDELEENFFPDMRAGGPCMSGLSPAAKNALIDRRMAWLLENEILRDGAPPPGGAR